MNVRKRLFSPVNPAFESVTCGYSYNAYDFYIRRQFEISPVIPRIAFDGY